MFNRREFIQRGFAVSALAVCPSAAARVAGGKTQPRQLLAVFDPAFQEGKAFGAEAVRLEISARSIRSDAGGVWMNDVEPRWKYGPAALAGLTDRASLFFFELMARDYGMGLVYRAEHALFDTGRARHSITGSAEFAGWESRLTRAGEHWGIVAAAMAVHGAQIYRPSARIELLDPAQPRGTRSLFSWVFATAYRPGVWHAAR
jgi:hypothetical protein